MKYFGILTARLAVSAIALLSAFCAAQKNSTSSEPSGNTKSLPSDLSGNSYNTKPVPQVKVITPFAENVPPSAKTDPLEYRSKDQMTQPDRSLAESAEPKIREEATLAGIEIKQGKWDFQQLICKALPDHVFLLYRWDNGPGDLSLFSVAIPRVGSGQVRVIPIERRGYSLFTLAAVNALTISKFNGIRADEPENTSADWLATALCYASLAGARPELSPPQAQPTGANLALSFPPTLEVASDGESTVRFVNVASQRQPTQWALTFTPQGRLVRVAHFPTPTYAAKPIPEH